MLLLSLLGCGWDIDIKTDSPFTVKLRSEKKSYEAGRMVPVTLSIEEQFHFQGQSYFLSVQGTDETLEIFSQGEKTLREDERYPLYKLQTMLFVRSSISQQATVSMKVENLAGRSAVAELSLLFKETE